MYSWSFFNSCFDIQIIFKDSKLVYMKSFEMNQPQKFVGDLSSYIRWMISMYICQNSTLVLVWIALVIQ